METFFQFIQANIPWLIYYKYLFFFLGSAIEGFSTMVLGGFLASVSGLGAALLFFVMSAGYIVNGFMWYAVGFFGGATSLDKWGHKHKLSHEVIQKVTMYFDQHSAKAIILSKLTFGFTIAIMIMAGSLKYNLKKFFVYNSVGSLLWASLTMGVGYFFGESLKYLTHAAKSLSLFLAFLVGAVAFLYIVKAVLKKYFRFSLNWNDRLQKIRRWLNGFDVDKGGVDRDSRNGV